ncbi:flagellar protein FlhE [Billgrantia endophytica]|nr:flagellar protein FlhE [Halomonas endophytica]
MSSLALAAGSWVATAPSVQVAMVDRPTRSALLVPPSPELARGQAIGQVSWRFQPPTGGEVDAWLCHVAGCVPLPGPRGQTAALKGMPADSPLHFQFTLRGHGQRVMTLQGLQVIVNHDHKRYR